MHRVLGPIPRRSIVGIGVIGLFCAGSGGFNGWVDDLFTLLVQISTRRTAQDAFGHGLGFPRFGSRSRFVAHGGEHSRDFIGLDNLAGLDGPHLPGLGDTQIANGHFGDGPQVGSQSGGFRSTFCLGNNRCGWCLAADGLGHRRGGLRLRGRLLGQLTSLLLQRLGLLLDGGLLGGQLLLRSLRDAHPQLTDPHQQLVVGEEEQARQVDDHIGDRRTHATHRILDPGIVDLMPQQPSRTGPAVLADLDTRDPTLAQIQHTHAGDHQTHRGDERSPTAQVIQGRNERSETEPQQQHREHPGAEAQGQIEPVDHMGPEATHPVPDGRIGLGGVDAKIQAVVGNQGSGQHHRHQDQQQALAVDPDTVLAGFLCPLFGRHG